MMIKNTTAATRFLSVYGVSRDCNIVLLCPSPFFVVVVVGGGGFLFLS